MSVITVANLSAKRQLSPSVREFIQGRNPTFVKNVGNLSTKKRTSVSTRGLIQGRDPMCVMNVGRPSARKQLLWHIGGHIQGRSLTNVLIVGRPLGTNPTWLITTEPTQERNHMNVVSVRNHSARKENQPNKQTPLSLHQRIHTGEKPCV